MKKIKFKNFLALLNKLKCCTISLDTSGGVNRYPFHITQKTIVVEVVPEGTVFIFQY